MMNASLKRLRRLLLLIPAAARAARAGRGLPLARAAEVCGASEAEIRADVAAIGSLWAEPTGAEDTIDVYLEDGEVHVTYFQTFEAPPAFSVAEGAVLIAALEPFEKDGGKPVKEALRKLRRAVPELLRPEVDRLARGLDLGGTPPEPWAASLQQAIAQRLEVTIDYKAVADAAISRRVLEPRLLFHRDGEWYLAAWNVEKKDEHLYRLDRIEQVVLGTRVFGEHQGPPIARYRKRNLYFESGAEREVTLRYTGLSATVRAARGDGKAAADGSVTVATKVTPGPFLTSYVLGHGGEAEVLAPADAAEGVRAAARRLLELYR
jgi:proteasome accessory factor C